MKTCPFCAEEIQDKAIKCRHCGTMLNEPVVPPAPADDYADVRELASQGMKIDAIKLLIANTGCSLKQAKDFVESPADASNDNILFSASTTKPIGFWANAMAQRRLIDHARGRAPLNGKRFVLSFLLIFIGFFLTLASSDSSGFGFLLLWIGSGFLLSSGAVNGVVKQWGGGLFMAVLVAAIGNGLGGHKWILEQAVAVFRFVSP